MFICSHLVDNATKQHQHEESKKKLFHSSPLTSDFLTYTPSAVCCSCGGSVIFGEATRLLSKFKPTHRRRITQQCNRIAGKFCWLSWKFSGTSANVATLYVSHKMMIYDNDTCPQTTKHTAEISKTNDNKMRKRLISKLNPIHSSTES